MNLKNHYNSKHLMVDIETLDTEPTSIILSLSAKFFRFNIGEINSFDIKFTLNDQIKIGRTMGEGTFFWWLKTNEMARLDIAEAEKRYSLYDGLMKFVEFIENNTSNKNYFIWSKSPNFDITIIENSLKYYNIEIPWKYSNTRDVRTIESLNPEITKNIYEEFKTNTHISSTDCTLQILTITKILEHFLKS